MEATVFPERSKKFLSWYVFKYCMHEVLFAFLSGTVLFLLIMLTFQAIRLAEFVVVHQVGLLDVGRLSAALMLNFVPIAVPMAFLFAVLMGISRANSEGEILALQANGVSLGQIFFPVAAFALVVSLGSLYAALYTVPQANRSFELLVTKLGAERVIGQLKPGVFNSGFFGLTLFAEQVVPVKNELKRVFIYDEREEAHPLAITAQAGIVKNRLDKGLLTLRLTEGSIHVENKTGESKLQRIDFDVYDINLEVTPSGSGWRSYSMPSYTYPMLLERLKETVPDPPEHRKLSVELHRRFSLSFSVAVFAALGFFIGILSQRGVRSVAILLCMLVALIYWLAFLAGNAVAARGNIAPWVAVWLPNVFFFGVAWLAYRKYRRG